MNDAPRWRRYLRFWGPDVDADVEDELRFHLEESARDLEAAGYPPDEALRLASARFGDVTRLRRWLSAHDHRSQRHHRRIEHMDALLLDLRYACRKLIMRPSFTISVVLVLAVGIGAATAMFSAVDAAMLRPLPFERSERLVMLDHVSIPHRDFGSDKSFTIGDARGMTDMFSHVAAFAPGGLNLGDEDSPVRVRVALITTDLFPMLGVGPASGRGFVEEEGTLEGPRVAIISDGLWRRQFGGDPNLVGRDVRLNEIPHRVVGIMPPRFGFPQDTEIWMPLAVPNEFSRWEPFGQYLPSTTLARLAPGVTVEQAANRVYNAVQARLDQELDSSPGEFARSYREALVGNRRTALLVLMGATALLLLVACANVTNLLLSRTAERRSEITLRSALGASRGRIVRQLLVESVMLSGAGGLLGVLVARAGLGMLTSLMPAVLAGTVPARLDMRVLSFSLVIAIGTGLFAGLWPALSASRSDPNDVVKAGGGSSSARDGARVRRTFVVAQLALALTMAVGAGLMLRSLDTLLSTDSGVRAEGVVTMELSLARAAFDTPEKSRQFVTGVLEQLEASPGVTSAAMVNELPMRGGGGVRFQLKPVEDDGERVMGQEIRVTRDYFDALGIPLLSGRLPQPATDSGAPTEMVVNREFARLLWPDEDPIGKQYTLMEPIPPRTVVGVVGDVRGQTLAEAAIPQMFAPLEEGPGRNLTVIARGAGSASALGALMTNAVRSVNPSQAVFNLRPMDEVIAGGIRQRRTNTLLITFFGLIAVVLAAIGVYGVVSYGVTRRSREIGIRIALGANSRSVLGLVMKEGVIMAVAGIMLGLLGAWALRRVLESMLYGVEPGDPVAFAGAVMSLMVIAVLATLLPAWRALRLDPTLTMKSE